MLFLEGTGSMTLDREQKIAYACLSPRTDIKVLERFGLLMKYRPVVFKAFDLKGNPIYHTNVMMCVGDQYVVIALDSLRDERERFHVKQIIGQSGKEMVEITMNQMNEFAGNMLQVHNKKGDKLLIMSTRAYASLRPDQVQSLTRYNRIVHASLDTIETNGGGSARCMIAEIHLPLLTKQAIDQ
jgi:hypothetical protein